MAGQIQPGNTTQGAYLGRVPEAPKLAANLPPLPPEPDFIYMASPRKWDVYTWSDGTQELLPQLSKLKLEPGLGGVSETGDITLALVAKRRKGLVEVPRKYGSDEDYVRMFDVQKGKLFVERWRTFVPNGAGVAQRVDTDGYLTFLRWVAATILPEPLPEVLEGRQELYRARLERQQEAAARNPARAVDVARTEEKIEAIDAFLEGAPTVPAKAQTKAQKRAKKAPVAEEVIDADE